MAPTVRAVGTVAAASAAAVSPGLPAGNAAGDLLIMFVMSSTSGEAITATGWTELTHVESPAAVRRNTVLYKIAAGSDATTTNTPSAVVMARIVGITTGTFDAVTPFNVSGTGTQAATTSVSVTGITTTRDGCLVFTSDVANAPDANSTTEFSSFANASWASVTEQIDNATSSGGGGAFGVASGVLTTAGATGTTTATAATSAGRADITLAVNPPSSARTQLILTGVG